MADFSVSISNSINCLGTDPSLWGDMVWGVDSWGYNSKTMSLGIEKVLDQELLVSDSTISKDVMHVVSESLSIESDADVITLKSGEYFYVYPLPTTNNDLVANTQWSLTGASGTSWTCLPAGSTQWSEN